MVDKGIQSRCAFQTPRRWHEPSRSGIQAQADSWALPTVRALAPRPLAPTRSDPAHEPLPPGAGEQGCAHGHLGSAPYPNARQDSMDRNAGDCSPGRPRHGSLDGPRRGHRHMQPSRRFTRKAYDLPWSVLAHASSVVTRGRLASGSHGLRWRAREGSFGIPGPGWPGTVSSVADPAGRRSHLRVYGRPARAALTAGG